MNQTPQRPPSRNTAPVHRTAGTPSHDRTPNSVRNAPSVAYRKRRVSSTTGALLYALVFFLVILGSLLFISHTRVNTKHGTDADTVPYVTISSIPSDSEIETESLDSNLYGPPSPKRLPPSVLHTYENADVYTGDLILINRDYPFVFPENQPQTVFYGNKSPVYMLNTISISLNTDIFHILDGMLVDFHAATGCAEVLLTSGFRTYEFQEELYASRVQTHGSEYAALYVALPGHSEHHSGRAVDMVIFSGGQQYYFPDYELASWLVDNAPDYGFILRYTEEKQSLTNCASEPWHYRYIGTPHARLVTELNYCFEEYHTFLQAYRWETQRLLISEDGRSYSVTEGHILPTEGYLVYYVPAADNMDTTEIPIPPNLSYTVSGDNQGGFIVTVHLTPPVE